MIKKLTLFILLFSVNGLLAQYVPTDEAYYKKYRKPIFASTIDISGGMSTPLGNWGAAPSLNQPLLAPFIGEDGMGAGNGYFVSLGMNVALRYDSDYKNASYWGLKFGLDASDHGYLNQWNEINQNLLGQESAFNLSFLIGTNYNYNINNVLVIEAGANVLLSVVSLAPELDYVGFDDDPNRFLIRTPEGTDDEIAWQPGFTLNFGIRFRRIRFYTELYQQGFNRTYEYVTYNNQNDEVVEVFNADFDVVNLRFGLSYLFNFE